MDQPSKPPAAAPTEAVNPRLLRLRVAAKLMLLLALLGVAYVFIAAFLSGAEDAESKPAFRVDIADLAAGQTRQQEWEGRPVLIHRRTAAEIAGLEQGDARLADPASEDSRQPDWATTASRSRDTEWFVAIGIGMDFSCPLEFLPASDSLFQGEPWSGGYIDTCRGSRYDPAGRVYRNQYADENLIVPDYELVDGAVMLGR